MNNDFGISLSSQDFESVLKAAMLCGLKQVGVIFRRKNYSKAALPFIMAAALVIAALLPAGLGTTVLIILGVFYCSHNREPYLQ